MANLYFEATLDAEQLKRELRQLNQRMTGFAQNTKQQGAEMDATFKRIGAAMAGYFSITAAKGFLDQMIQVRGEFQQLDIALQTMLGSKAESDKLMAEVVELAANTPFSLTELGQGAKRLLAFKEPVDQVGDSLRRLGDLAAGASVPVTDLIQAYGKVSAKGKMQAEELNQFAERGIPIISELAKVVGATDKEIYKMAEQGKIGFPELQKAIRNMTDEGGMFFNLMEKQSASLTGRISNLGDAWDRMLNELGTSSEGAINNSIAGLNYLVDNYETVIDILKVIVATYGAYRGAIIAANLALKAQAAMGAIQAWVSLARGIKSAKDAQIAFNLASKMNPWGLAAAGIAALVTGIALFANKAKSTEDIISGLNESVSNFSGSGKDIERLSSEYETLRGKAERTKDENDRLNTVMEALTKSVPGVVTEFDEYGKVLDINIGKVKEFGEAQKEAAKIQLTQQIKDAKSQVEQLNKDLEPLQRLFQTGRGEKVSYSQYGTVRTPYNASEEAIAEAAAEANKIYAEREELLKSIAQAQNALNNLTAEAPPPDPDPDPDPDGESTLEKYKKHLSDQKKAYDDYNDTMRAARDEDKAALADYYKDLTAQGEDYEEYLKNQLEAFRGNVEAKAAIYQAAASAKIVIDPDNPSKITRRPSAGIGTSTVEIDRISLPQSEIDKWGKLREATEKALDVENIEEFARGSIEAAYGLQEMAQSVGQVDSEMGDLLMSMADVVGLVGNLTKMAASGDFVGVAVGVTNSAISSIAKLVSESKKREQAERDFYVSISSLQSSYLLMLNEQLRLQGELSENLFSTDYQGRLTSGIKAFDDAANQYNESLQELQERGQVKLGVETSFNLGKLIEDTFNSGNIVESVGNFVSSIFGGNQQETQWGNLLETYPALVDEAGKLNIELADAILAEGILNEETTNLLQNTSDWAKQMEAAKEQIKGVIGDLAGGLGDDLREALVSSFKDGTDAAVKFGESVEKVLENVLSQMIFNQAFGAIFSNLEKEMEESFAEGGDMSWIDDFQRAFEGVGGASDEFNKAVEEAKKAAADAGFNIFGAGSDDSLSGAIKGVSEQTASILAGQMNAIRINQAESLRIMNESVRYQAQIAVNTGYNQHLEGIHSELSAIRASGSDLKSKGL